MATTKKLTPADLKAKAAKVKLAHKRSAHRAAAIREAAEASRIEHEVAAQEAQELEDALALANEREALEQAHAADRAEEHTEQIYPPVFDQPVPTPQAVDWSRPVPSSEPLHEWPVGELSVRPKTRSNWYLWIAAVLLLVLAYLLLRWGVIFATNSSALVN